MFRTNTVEKIKTRVLFSVPFFRKSCLLWGNGEKYSCTGHRWQYTMAHALCMLDN